ncbi:putative o-methyltransferase [Neofusicoccum parvum]|nr:putative o-methyltransferase [Neofusicoccum parvum]
MVSYPRFPEYLRTYCRKKPLEPPHQPHGLGWGVAEKDFWDAVEGQRCADFNISMQTLDRMLHIKRSLPELPAERFVLQDREGAIKDAENSRPPELKSVKTMPHDFLEPQHVKRALVYVLRRIMRDRSDKHNAQILGHCRYAMAPHSRILIVDQVMPNPLTTLPCQADICMVDHIL